MKRARFDTLSSRPRVDRTRLVRRLATGLAALLALFLVAIWGWRTWADPAVEPEARTVEAPRSERLELADLEAGSASAPAAHETADLEAPRAPERLSDPGPYVPPDRAMLSVRVVARETGRPLAGVRVSAHRVASGRVLGPTCASVLTSDDGRADMLVFPYVQTRVFADPDTVDAGPVEATFAGPPPGERRVARVEVPTARDQVFCGRVLERETRLPVPGARVSLLERSPNARFGPGTAETDPEGAFRFARAAWDPELLRVDAPTFARALVTAMPGHATADRALEILLDRAPRVRVVLTQWGEPLANAPVTACTERENLVQPRGSLTARSGTLCWTASTDASGTARFADLPVRVPIELDTVHRVREPYEKRATRVLQAGEDVLIEWEIAGCVSGLVLKSNGAAAAGASVWIERAAPEPASGIEVVAERRFVNADGEGRFRIVHVPAGKHLVGAFVADGPRGMRDESSPGEAVDVRSGQAEASVTVRLAAALTIRGHVLDARGGPLGSGSVRAWSGLRRTERVRLADDGSFELGPLNAGTWSVQAWSGTGAASSEVVEIAAGTDDAVIRLRQGGTVRVALGEDWGGVLAAQELDPRSIVIRDSYRAHDGFYELEELLPGSWTLSSLSGRFACRRGVRVEAGRTTLVELAPAAAARLLVGIGGSTKPIAAWVEHAGAVVGLRVFQGANGWIHAPAGRCTVRVELTDGRFLSTELDIGPDEDERSIHWDGARWR